MKRLHGILFAAVLAAALALPSCSSNDSAQEEVISKRIKIAEEVPSDGTQAQTAPPEGTITSMAAPQASATAPEPVKTVEEPKRPAGVDASTEPPKEEKEKKTIKIEVKEAESAATAVEKKAPQEKEAAKAKAEKKPAKKKAVAQKAAPRIWAINVASFKSLKDAQDMTTSLKLAGYNSYITPFTKNGVGWHRVRIGFYRTREEAEKAGQSVKKRFRIETPWVVKAARAEATEHAQ